MNKINIAAKKILRSIQARKKLFSSFFVFAIMLAISGAIVLSVKEKDDNKVGNSGKQEVLGQEKTKRKELHLTEKSCEAGDAQGYVRVSGSVVKPQWLAQETVLKIIVDDEIYPVSTAGTFCLFALKKTGIISVVADKDYENPLLLYALAGNKDKSIIIDTYSTAVALIFRGTQSMWSRSALEESITAFSFIQQDGNTQKLADAIASSTTFMAKDVTRKKSDVAVAYQQAITSIENKRRSEIPEEAEVSFVVILGPVDFYRDSETEYSITGKIVSLEKVSQQLLLQSDVAKNIRIGNQIGIFFDAAKIMPPLEQLQIGYNDKQAKITARFDKAKGQFVAEELSVL